MTIFDDVLGHLTAEQVSEAERAPQLTKTESQRATAAGDEPLGDLVQLARLDDF